MQLYELIAMLDELRFTNALTGYLQKRLKSDDIIHTLETSRDLAKWLRKENLIGHRRDREAVRYIEQAENLNNEPDFKRIMTAYGIEGELRDLLLIQFRKGDPEVKRVLCAQDLKVYLEKYADALPDSVFDDICKFLERRERIWFENHHTLLNYLLSFGIEQGSAHPVAVHLRDHSKDDISEAIRSCKNEKDLARVIFAHGPKINRLGPKRVNDIVQLLTGGEGLEAAATTEEKKEEPEKVEGVREEVKEELLAIASKLQDVGMMFIDLSGQLEKAVDGILKLNV